MAQSNAHNWGTYFTKTIMIVKAFYHPVGSYRYYYGFSISPEWATDYRRGGSTPDNMLEVTESQPGTWRRTSAEGVNPVPIHSPSLTGSMRFHPMQIMRRHVPGYDLVVILFPIGGCHPRLYSSRTFGALFFSTLTLENRSLSFATPSLLTFHFSFLTPSIKRLGAQAMCLRSEERENL